MKVRVTSSPFTPTVFVELFDTIPTVFSVGNVRSVVTLVELVTAVTFVPEIPAPLLKLTTNVTAPSPSLEFASYFAVQLRPLPLYEIELSVMAAPLDLNTTVGWVISSLA